MKNTKKPFVHPKRHIAKTITWRIVGTLDTWVISWLLVYYLGEKPEEATQAASFIALLEMITKTILYYLHERVWYRISWGNTKQKIRHLIKTISWRFVGALDTIALVFLVYYILFSTTDGAAEVAISMFSIEVITKMILYYIHERIWFSSNWGVKK